MAFKDLPKRSRILRISTLTLMAFIFIFYISLPFFLKAGYDNFVRNSIVLVNSFLMPIMSILLIVCVVDIWTVKRK